MFALIPRKKKEMHKHGWLTWMRGKWKDGCFSANVFLVQYVLGAQIKVVAVN